MRLSSFFMALALVLSAFPAQAVLGEKLETTTFFSTQKLGPSVQGHEQDEGPLKIRQYTANQGRVFAISWDGRRHPALRELLGSHFATFRKALKQARVLRGGHSPIDVDADGLHVEMGGTPRAVYGHIWLKSELPDGVDTRELR